MNNKSINFNVELGEIILSTDEIFALREGDEFVVKMDLDNRLKVTLGEEHLFWGRLLEREDKMYLQILEANEEN